MKGPATKRKKHNSLPQHELSLKFDAMACLPLFVAAFPRSLHIGILCRLLLPFLKYTFIDI